MQEDCVCIFPWSKNIRMFSIVLSKDKNEKQHWGVIFVAVDGLLYMPNESSASWDGFCDVIFGSNRANM